MAKGSHERGESESEGERDGQRVVSGAGDGPVDQRGARYGDPREDEDEAADELRDRRTGAAARPASVEAASARAPFRGTGPAVGPRFSRGGS